ncbi:cutC family domain-containing protein [Phthorimaea operculella]|nr:cutC family domain-containing protein [Phthorimaea operculella]
MQSFSITFGSLKIHLPSGKVKAMLLEVCVDSLESATNAVYNGADELEVCNALSAGGLTPPFDVVKQIIDMIELYMVSQGLQKKPKVNVMIRCREGWDFIYNTDELEQMIQSITEFKKLNIDRFVFGALTDTGDIDVIACEKIISHASPIPVTFHRAFDHCKDPRKAIEDIIRVGFNRLLTSGQRKSAAEKQAVKLILQLFHKYGDVIQIMPGAGITLDNAKIFTNLGVDIIHGSFRRERLGTSNQIVYVTDGQVVKKVKNIIA